MFEYTEKDLLENRREWIDRFSVVLAQLQFNDETGRKTPDAFMNIFRRWFDETCDEGGDAE